MSSSVTMPTTPNSRATSSANNTGPSTSALDDINYLLYLETLKRFKDDEAHIRRQVEEKTRQYQEIKFEYLHQYSKYVSLIKLAATRATLENDILLDDGQNDAALDDVSGIAQKLATGTMTDFIDPNELAKCKELLHNACKPHENLELLQRELAANKAAVRSIQAATEAVEATVETATVQGLSHFVEELKLDCFDESPEH